MDSGHSHLSSTLVASWVIATLTVWPVESRGESQALTYETARVAVTGHDNSGVQRRHRIKDG